MWREGKDSRHKPLVASTLVRAHPVALACSCTVIARGSRSTQTDTRSYHKARFNPRAAQKKGESGGGRSIRAAEQTPELNRNPECQLKQGI